MPHIPVKDFAVNTFDAELNSNDKVDYDETKWICVPRNYKEFRYILGTRGKNPLICFGINPSTASPDNLDNTLKSVQNIALSNGYDSFIMLNIYPQRATYPKDMPKDEASVMLRAENLKAFEYAITLSPTKDVWLAYGNTIDKRAYLKNYLFDVLRVGMAANVNWLYSEKKLKTGNPHHPLYLKKDSKINKVAILPPCERGSV